MKMSRWLLRVLILAGIILGVVFLYIPREEFSITREGASCEGCLDIMEVTTTETTYGFPRAWKTVVEKNGWDGYAAGEGGMNYGIAVIDFVTGFMVGAIPAFLIHVTQGKKK